MVKELGKSKSVVTKLLDSQRNCLGGRDIDYWVYNLLLDSRRKHERPDDFWAAFDFLKIVVS